MPRPPRPDHAGAWHHVMNRGASRAPLFVDDIDRRILLSELADSCARHRVEVHAYCLLTNHYHLLLHTPHGALSSAMQRCASRFTLATNRRHGRDGPIFRGRFNSVLVEDDSQLTQLTRYIHRNPIEARLATRPEAWPWSSAGAYVGTALGPEWLYTAPVLAMFGGSTAAYRAFLSD